MKAILLLINIISSSCLVSAVTNGEPTSIDQYPWLAIIEYGDSGKLCAGSLIYNRWVVTAAHCLVTLSKIDRNAKSVRLGDYNTSNDGRDCVETAEAIAQCNDGTKTFDIVKQIVHPDFAKDKAVFGANDIALLKLNDTVTYSDFIKPISLPNLDVTTLPTFNGRFTIAGWGAFNSTKMFSDIKLHTELPYVNLISCQGEYARIKRAVVWNKQICAGGENGKDSCGGDAGGPLMYPDGDTYELTGIISYGARTCGIEGKPSVFTKVYEYITWIKSNIDDSE